MASIEVLIFLAVGAFLSSMVFCAMGFGMAITFLFLYQIGALAGLENCCGLPKLREIVFLQTIALASAQLVLLWGVGLKKNVRWEILILMIPSQLVAAPLGQLLQDHTPNSVLKMIVGLLTIIVAAWQLVKIYQAARKTSTKKDKTVERKLPVYFIIGIQRSGSNWLQLLLNDRHPTLAAPHPPHILKNFLPVLSKFGDLNVDANFQNLINIVCDFVEENPVKWTDESQNNIILDRVELFNSCSHNRTLISIFEELMNTYTRRNSCNTWLCKSMNVGQYHKELLAHFGERLHYIFLYRDPRDVTFSFVKAPIGPAHSYIAAENWASQQRIALDIISRFPRVHKISYEALLLDTETHLKVIDTFLRKTPEEAKERSGNSAIEAENRANKSALWASLKRGDSFKEEQLGKWRRQGSETELEMIESAAWEEMDLLGYHEKVTTEKRNYTTEELEGFREADIVGRIIKDKRLKEENYEDWSRRRTRMEILERFREQDNSLVKANKNTEAEMMEERFDSLRRGGRESGNWASWIKSKGREVGKELWPPRPKAVWMFLAGFVSGFLGGLISVRGPPLILYFFVYEYPRSQIKANGAAIAAVNLLVRVITYSSRSPPAEYPHKSWFAEEEVVLYVVLAVCSLIAAPIGLYLSRYLNRGSYKAALAVLLIVNGITMIITSSIDLSND